MTRSGRQAKSMDIARRDDDLYRVDFEDPKLRKWAVSHTFGLESDFPLSPADYLELEKENLEDMLCIRRLQLAIAKRRARTAPVRRLPSHLLARIFAQISESRLYISQCCRRWRKVSLETPNMWTNLDLKHSCNGTQCAMRPIVLQSLAHSGSLPLFVKIYEEDSLYECSTFQRLIESAHRWKTFVIRGPSRSMHRIAAASPELCLLTKLTMDIIPPSPSYIRHRVKNSEVELPKLRPLYPANQTIIAPLLHTVKVSGNPRDLPRTICPKLKDLCIERSRGTITDVITVFTDTTKLKNLTLGLSIPRITDPVVAPTFPILDRLCIQDLGNIWNRIISDPIIQGSPCLRQLEIHLQDNWDEAPTTKILSVQQLEFHIKSGKPPKSDKSVARAWSNSFPSLTSLSITYERGAPKSVFVSGLIGAHKKNPSFPYLKTLCLKNAEVDKSTLIEFSKARSLAPDGDLKGDSYDLVLPCSITLDASVALPKVDNATVRELRALL